MPMQPLDSDQAVIVYLDFKSPYAYLAVEPTRRVEQELGLKFDWRPFVLDIPSYLGSASLDDGGKVATQDRSTEQWKAIKYAYYDCRRYASISNLTIRGTTKIWDTNLAATAMLWVRENAIEQLPRFIDLVYAPFWKRELDIQDPSKINSILEECGLAAASFEQWAAVEGSEINAELQKQAFAAGVYGVPSYVVNGEVFFGREHLPRIAWLLGDQTQTAPDVSNLLSNEPHLTNPDAPQVIVGIDDSMDSLLAIPRLRALFEKNEIDPKWTMISSQQLDKLIPPDQANSRGELHRQYRDQTTLKNLQRYGQEIRQVENIVEQIEQTIENNGIELSDNPGDQLEPSPFPGIVVKVDEDVFIGRQHLPLISALIS